MLVIAVVPSKQMRVYVSGRGAAFPDPGRFIAWLDSQRNGSSPTVLGVMGGPGQELFSRIQDMGISVSRLPFYRMKVIAGVEPKASEEDRIAALEMAWEQQPEAFYGLASLDADVVLVRELTRQRLNIQGFRNSATLQVYGALRSLQFVLPEEAAELVKLLYRGLKDQFRKPELRNLIEAEFSRLANEVHLTSQQQARIFAIRGFFSNPSFVLGAKTDEEELEKRITGLLKGMEIWRWMHPGNPGKDSALPDLKGFGPAIGGAVVGEIGDIRRFPSANDLRAYARFHVNREGKFPHRQRGEISSWNRYLNRAAWLWSSDQLARYPGVWKTVYLVKKAQELQAHPEVVERPVTDRAGHSRTVFDFTLGHLDKRAKRYTGSVLLEYIWELWTAIAEGQDPEAWYAGSSWPALFSRGESELPAVQEYLAIEIPKRRRVQPAQKEDEEDEFEVDN